MACVVVEKSCNFGLIAVDCWQRMWNWSSWHLSDVHICCLINHSIGSSSYVSPPCRIAVLWTISWASALNSSKLLYFPSEMFCRRTEDTLEHAEAYVTFEFFLRVCTSCMLSTSRGVWINLLYMGCFDSFPLLCRSTAWKKIRWKKSASYFIKKLSVISTWFSVEKVRSESVKHTLSFIRPRMNFRYVVISCLFKFFLLLPC